MQCIASLRFFASPLQACTKIANNALRIPFTRFLHIAYITSRSTYIAYLYILMQMVSGAIHMGIYVAYITCNMHMSNVVVVCQCRWILTNGMAASRAASRAVAPNGPESTQSKM